MHFLGFAGMPRRIPDYPYAFTSWNHLASIGSLISVFAILIFIVIFYNSFKKKEKLSRKYSWTYEHGL
jgi:cytochrome c oxidase subunit 1